MSDPSAAIQDLSRPWEQIEAINRAVIDGGAQRAAFMDEAIGGQQIAFVGHAPCVQVLVCTLFEMLVRHHHDSYDAVRILNSGGWGELLLNLEEQG